MHIFPDVFNFFTETANFISGILQKLKTYLNRDNVKLPIKKGSTDFHKSHISKGKSQKVNPPGMLFTFYTVRTDIQITESTKAQHSISQMWVIEINRGLNKLKVMTRVLRINFSFKLRSVQLLDFQFSVISPKLLQLFSRKCEHFNASISTYCVLLWEGDPIPLASPKCQRENNFSNYSTKSISTKLINLPLFEDGSVPHRLQRDSSIITCLKFLLARKAADPNMYTVSIVQVIVDRYTIMLLPLTWFAIKVHSMGKLGFIFNALFVI